MNLLYKIQFYSEWQCSSGLTSGHDVDNLVIKDEELLPYIPGKTLKGLIRDAAETISGLTKNDDWNLFVITHFGKRAAVSEAEKDNNPRAPGIVYFSNAELTLEIKQYLCTDIEKKNLLYRKIASTAIDEQGIARENSLRKTEVVIPLTLFGEIKNCMDVKKMKKCLQWIKQMGSKRNRGLGRCDFMVIREST